MNAGAIFSKRLVTMVFLAASAWMMLPENVSHLLAASAARLGSEARAVAFLEREVPLWSQTSGCFSCHNNGDGARALYAAKSGGIVVNDAALSETTTWLKQPGRWDENKGDPGFGDKHLADIQFAGALIAAHNAGLITDRAVINQAATRLIAKQEPDGAWRIRPEAAIGSPATYGTALATVMALRTLRYSDLPAAKVALRKGSAWLTTLRAASTFDLSVLLLAAQDGAEIAERTRLAWIDTLVRTQTSDGGWGPYPDAVPEPFDTALAMLALAPLRAKSGATSGLDKALMMRIETAIISGRRFLLSTQEEDGGWAATTRPARGESYAQRISTSGWATSALLQTR